MDWLRTTTRAVADLALGRCCAGCDRPGGHLCQTCSERMQPRVRLHTRLRLDDVSLGLSIPVLTSLEYSGVCRQILYRYKDHGDLSVTSVLASAVAVTLQAVGTVTGTSPAVAIPVPTRRSAARHRGFLPVERILRAAITGSSPTIHRVLVDTRRQRADKGLGAADRQAVVAGAFRISGQVPHVPAVLVDDVVTTGATLRESAITLMHAGVHLVAAVAVAGTPSGGWSESVGVRR